ncbi:MAG TPA: hypothetical protein VL092_08040 [Chitinophagaceae bacterium]|nr:hypothetical protein [Chitinophagaceae bacterium]
MPTTRGISAFILIPFRTAVIITIVRTYPNNNNNNHSSAGSG